MSRQCLELEGAAAVLDPALSLQEMQGLEGRKHPRQPRRVSHGGEPAELLLGEQRFEIGGVEVPAPGNTMLRRVAYAPASDATPVVGGDDHGREA